ASSTRWTPCDGSRSRPMAPSSCSPTTGRSCWRADDGGARSHGPLRSRPRLLVWPAEPMTGSLPPGGLLLVAAGALVDADHRVLLTRRPEGKPMAGLWEFPGGKVLPGETPEACV